MIIPKIGRKSFKMRILIAFLYITLSLGAVTMIYPFMLMLATSITSRVDVNEFRVVPRYLYKEEILFAKYADGKYRSDMELLNNSYGTDFAKPEEVCPPKIDPSNPKTVAMAKDWWAFQKTFSTTDQYSCFQGFGKDYSPLRRQYQLWLMKRFNGRLDKLNREYVEENETFFSIYIPFERHQTREWEPETSPKMHDWIIYKKTLPREFLQITPADSMYATYLDQDKYDGSLDKLNAAQGTKYKNFFEAHLPPTLPENLKERPDWEGFVRNKMPFRLITVDKAATPVYQNYLKARYPSIAEVNEKYKANYASFEAITLPKELPFEGPMLLDWGDFISKVVPITMVKATSPDNLYRDSILKKYGSIDGINKAYGTHFSNLTELGVPIGIADWVYTHQNTHKLRNYFLTMNYRMVTNYISLHGNALVNTLIFVLAVIITSLIVNPLCAYALSRYNLRYSYKVLLFLLATMAFPAEVAMIPNFLLLKQFHMLNTFWALVLPGMASGFSIFLLKGFFDSLPRELYEAGTIDGASEARMFFKITIPLSKPIFAVIALQSFTAAYGAFMFALLVCQNPKMWTLMVWLYELQIGAPQFITMAALTLAAMPTLIVFIFAQNVIMRGIIIPSFK